MNIYEDGWGTRMRRYERLAWMHRKRIKTKSKQCERAFFTCSGSLVPCVPDSVEKEKIEKIVKISLSSLERLVVPMVDPKKTETDH